MEKVIWFCTVIAFTWSSVPVKAQLHEVHPVICEENILSVEASMTLQLGDEKTMTRFHSMSPCEQLFFVASFHKPDEVPILIYEALEELTGQQTGMVWITCHQNTFPSLPDLQRYLLKWQKEWNCAAEKINR